MITISWNWIPITEQHPPSYTDILAVIQYLDAPFNMEVGGYVSSKSFWTDPVVLITTGHQDLTGNYIPVCGGKITHWMVLPALPEFNFGPTPGDGETNKQERAQPKEANSG
jgi:hypothetical protein